MEKKPVKRKKSVKVESKKVGKVGRKKKEEIFRYGNEGVGSFVAKIDTVSTSRIAESKEPLAVGKNTAMYMKDKMKKAAPAVSRWQRMNRFYLGIAMMIALVAGSAYATYTFATAWFDANHAAVSQTVNWEQWIKNTSGQNDAYKGPVSKELSAKSYRSNQKLMKRDLHKSHGSIKGHKKGKKHDKMLGKKSVHHKRSLALHKKTPKHSKKKAFRVAQQSHRQSGVRH